MNTIIAGTDFTPSSINACKYAALLAEKLHCKLTLFNLFDAPVVRSNIGLYGLSYTALRKNSEKKTIKLIQELTELFPKIKINQFVTSGAFRMELENFTSTHKVEVAVMGLKSKDWLSKSIYGSHGVNIAGKINAPVIIVPQKYKNHKLSEVLLAVDNNRKLYKSSLQCFERFIKRSKSKVKLLHVRTEEEVFNPVINSLKINGEELPIVVLKAKDIQRGINGYCNEQPIDLVSVISKRHSIFNNIFSESNTQKVAYDAKVPVMAIHE